MEYNETMKRLIAIFLPILSLPVFSRIWGHIVRIKHPFLAKRAIRRFRCHYGIDMDEYRGEPTDYKCLADFFVRPLDPEKRPLTGEKTAVLSPADGVLTEIETIFEDRATQIKGKEYSISAFLKEDIDFSEGWHVAVIYLSPYNYHRYHYPVSGKITRYYHTGGRLFPVNQMGLNHIRSLFVRNERIVTEIEKDGMAFYITAVGATFVGSIKMEFIPGTAGKKRDRWEAVNKDISQLQEMGRFEMGSTIVLVIPRKMAEPINGVRGKSIRVGEPIFKLC